MFTVDFTDLENQARARSEAETETLNKFKHLVDLFNTYVSKRNEADQYLQKYLPADNVHGLQYVLNPITSAEQEIQSFIREHLSPGAPI